MILIRCLSCIAAITLAGFSGNAWCCAQSEAAEPTAVPAETQEIVPAQPERFDPKLLNGSWKPITGTLAGRSLPQAQLESLKLTIDGERYQARGTGFEEAGKILVRQDPDSVATVNLHIDSGANAGKLVRGILSVTTERLVVCYAIVGERPETFESTEFNQALYLEYEKVQNDVQSLKPRDP